MKLSGLLSGSMILLAIFLFCTAVAVDDCDFMGDVDTETQQVTATCRCTVSEDACPGCTKKIRSVYIKPAAETRPWTITKLFTNKTLTSVEYVRNTTYKFTLDEGVDHPRGEVTFTCRAEGLDYSKRSKTKHYVLAINFLETANFTTLNEVTTVNPTSAEEAGTTVNPTNAKEISTVDPAATTTTTTVDPKKHDCDFSSKMQTETQRVVLSCRCRASANKCPYCTMKIQYLYIKPLRPTPWIVPELFSIPRRTSDDYVRNSTYGFTLNQSYSGLSSHAAEVTFVCGVQGLDYTWHAKDQDYLLEINFSNYYNASFSNASFLRAGRAKIKPTTVLTRYVTPKEEATTTTEPTEVNIVLNIPPLLPAVLFFSITLLPLAMFFCLLCCFFRNPLPE